MSKRIPGDEKNRFFCTNCGFPCDTEVNQLGDYGLAGWDFTDGYTIADDGIATATNLISNGLFTANTTGWTAVDSTLASAGSGQAGNCLQITRTDEDLQYAYQQLSGLTVGFLYRIRAYVKSGTSGNEAYAIRIYDADISRVLYSVTGTTTTSWVLADPLYFRASQANNIVALVKNSDTAGTMFFDTVDGYGYEFKVKETLTGCHFCGCKNWKR